MIGGYCFTYSFAESVSTVGSMVTDRNGRSHQPAGAGGGQFAPTSRPEGTVELEPSVLRTTAQPISRACVVPPVGHEEHHWLAENNGTASRAAMAAASGFYESTVPAQIADLTIDLPAVLAADAEEAAAELSRFDQHARARLGSGSPALGPMSAILLRTESASSSQIENLTAGARQLALAEIGQSTSDNAAIVTANVRTMEAALRLADDLDEQAILAMHRELLSAQPGWSDHAGRYREQLVWVGAAASPRAVPLMWDLRPSSCQGRCETSPPSFGDRTCKSLPKLRSPMPSSRPSTPLPTGTDARGGHWCTRWSAQKASLRTRPPRYQRDC